MLRSLFSFVAISASLKIAAMPLEEVFGFGVLEVCEPIENKIEEIEFDNSNIYDQFAQAIIRKDIAESRILLDSFESTDRYVLHLLAGLENDRDFLGKLRIAERLTRESLVEFAFLSASYSNFEAVSYAKSAGIGPGEKIGNSNLATSLGICFFHSL